MGDFMAALVTASSSFEDVAQSLSKLCDQGVSDRRNLIQGIFLDIVSTDNLSPEDKCTRLMTIVDNLVGDTRSVNPETASSLQSSRLGRPPDPTWFSPGDGVSLFKSQTDGQDNSPPR